MLWLVALPVAAQEGRIDGQVVTRSIDGKSVEGLPYVGVAVLDAADSSLVKGVSGDAEGRFVLRFHIKKGMRYLLKASYTGMEPYYRLLKPSEATLHAGILLLKEADTALGEVTVTGQAKEVRQVKDTTVINATVYKTPEGSMLGELIKRIPGLDYDRATQTITYNGKIIQEINVNGETFFGGDRAMALENLPVEIIDKIKVYDKKSKLEKATGVSNGKEHYVLDLQTKKAYDTTLLASGKAGYGSHRKKELGLMANYFRTDGEGYSLMARSSNREMESVYRGNTSNMAGINLNKKLKEGLGGYANLSYGRSRTGNESTSYNEQYLAAGNKYLNGSNQSENGNRSFSGAAGFSWDIGERTFVNVATSFGRSQGNATSANRQAAFTANPHTDITRPFANPELVPDSIRLNENHAQSLSDNRQRNYSFYADMTRKLNKKGTNLSITLQFNGNRGDSRSFNRSSIIYYRLTGAGGGDSAYYQNQYRETPSKATNRSFGLRMTHPFTEKLSMQLAYTFNHSREKSDRNTYDLSAFQEASSPLGFLPEAYAEGYTDSLSNRSNSLTEGHSVSLYVNYFSDRWTADFGMVAQPARRSLFQKTGSAMADSTMRYVELEPSFSLSWTKGERYINLSYHGNTSQPDLSSLLSLTDTGNPLNITRGNPDLKPSYSQSVSVDANDTRIGLSFSWNWQNTLNSQTTVVTYNSRTGGSVSHPDNINGNWGTNGSLRYQKRIRAFNVSAMTRASFNRNVSLLDEEMNGIPRRSSTRNSGSGAELQLAYDPSWGSFEAAGTWDFNHSSNSLRQTGTTLRNYTFSLNAGADVLKNLRIATDALYAFRNGTNIRPGEDDQLVWNASVTYRFLKKKQGELSAYWTDILSRKKSYGRTVTASGLSEYHNRQIGSYFLLTFKYKLTMALHNNTK